MEANKISFSAIDKKNFEPVISLTPLKIQKDGYRVLEVKVSAPISGNGLPVIIFAHGFGSSMDGYTPLVNYWASCGLLSSSLLLQIPESMQKIIILIILQQYRSF